MTHLWPRCRASNTTCKAQGNMKIQHPPCSKSRIKKKTDIFWIELPWWFLLLIVTVPWTNGVCGVSLHWGACPVTGCSYPVLRPPPVVVGTVITEWGREAGGWSPVWGGREVAGHGTSHISKLRDPSACSAVPSDFLMKHKCKDKVLRILRW